MSATAVINRTKRIEWPFAAPTAGDPQPDTATRRFLQKAAPRRPGEDVYTQRDMPGWSAAHVRGDRRGCVHEEAMRSDVRHLALFTRTPLPFAL